MSGKPLRENSRQTAASRVWRPDASAVRRSAAAFWQNLFFVAAERLPRTTRSLVPLWARAAWLFSPALRDGSTANGDWLLGKDATASQRRRFSRRVATNFFRFVCDVAEGGRLWPHHLRKRITAVEGEQHYQAARRSGRGVVVATAHLGSFEVGMAALSELEPRVNVVFQRDRVGRFERLRHRLHRRLGVAEAPVDEGWEAWARLRNALLADEVVLMQADRAMPGQRSRPVPFCGGHIRLPIGPVKLAQMTGSPIVPIFATRHRDGVRIRIEPPIAVEEPQQEVLHRLAEAIEKHVSAHPEQWLVLYRAWVEDEPEASEPASDGGQVQS